MTEREFVELFVLAESIRARDHSFTQSIDDGKAAYMAIQSRTNYEYAESRTVLLQKIAYAIEQLAMNRYKP